MAKSTRIYICKNCGYKSLTWRGNCPECGQWNTFEEVIMEKKEIKSESKIAGKYYKINEIGAEEEKRIKTGIPEIDRVLGGGAVKGSLILIGGEPGIGKSTLLLQIANTISKKIPVLYVSGEESVWQIKLRANRLKVSQENLYITSDGEIGRIYGLIEQLNPEVLIIDSIQTVYSDNLNTIPGSVSQVRECGSKIQEITKQKKLITFMISHITKEGTIAGPKLLEHLVDVVLYLEGDRSSFLRILRSIKNRFGAVDEIGVFEMTSEGLKEIRNPSQYFIGENHREVIGSAITPVMEGLRPIFVEIQALVVPSAYPYGKRVIEGIDYNKVSIIVAILEKFLGLKLLNKEIYVKVSGGIKIKEPSIDLAIAVALFSTVKEIPIKSNIFFSGEISLTGEIKRVPLINQRIKEGKKIGFKQAMLPEDEYTINKEIELIKIRHLKQLKDFFKKEVKSV